MTPRVLRLSKVWAELCRFCMMQLGNADEYGVGFIFDTEVLASYSRKSDAHWLMLNPLKNPNGEGSSPTYRPNDIDDLKLLYALAIHEVTHLVDGIESHNVNFAYALTMNTAKLADGFRQVRKIVRTIRSEGHPKLVKGRE
jgi:hypothetical protein